MATLDNMILVSEPLGSVGAAFRLNGLALEDVTTSLDPNWTVEVRKGSKYVVARCTRTVTGYQQLRDEAYSWAQKGLDIVAIRRCGDLSVCEPKNEHITWWDAAVGPVLRMTSIATLRSNTNATCVVIDKHGNPVLPPPPSTRWHESLRYFRLSQTTDDLFDAYRNLYLALESILDFIEPQKLKPPTAGGMPRPAESERQWLKRALRAADSLVGMARFAPPGSTNPVDFVFEEIYTAVRTGLFHAKGSRARHLPHSAADFPAVREALRRISKLYLALAKKLLGVSYGSGIVTYEGFADMMDNLTPHFAISLADRQLRVNLATRDLDLAGAVVLDLPTAAEPTLDGPFLKSFVGAAAAVDLVGMPTIGAILGRHDGKVIAQGALDCQLTVDGFALIEAHVGIRLRNIREPKDFFGT
jgi:hypothetical protein